MSTIVLAMGTMHATPTIGTALFGQTQRALLALLFLRPEESFYLRQIVRTAGIGQGAAQRELARWVEAGLLVRTERGNQVHFQANARSPVFAELRSLAVKTAGVGDVLREALAPLAARIEVAFIHGSMARGTQQSVSDVDVIIIGSVSFGDIVAAISPTQNVIGREVNPTVYPVAEFRAKLRAKQHFVTAVVKSPKIFLVGDDHELERLGT